MANIASNTYLFYSDNRKELEKVYDSISDFWDKYESKTTTRHFGLTPEGDVVNPSSEENEKLNKDYMTAEWMEYLDELCDTDNQFCLYTTSKWYGNPEYWYAWLNKNFNDVKMAYECIEPGCDILDMYDPDDKLDEKVILIAYDLTAEEIKKLPVEIQNVLWKCGGRFHQADNEDNHYLFQVFSKQQLEDWKFDITKLSNKWYVVKTNYLESIG